MEIVRRHTDYALRALVYLAEPGRERTPCAELGEACDIPFNFAQKILQKLSRCGLVTSLPGRSGGFRLAKPAREIRLSDVVEAVQGPISFSRCVVDPKSCSRSSDCSISASLSVLQREVVDFLGTTTISDAVTASGTRDSERTGETRVRSQ